MFYFKYHNFYHSAFVYFFSILDSNKNILEMLELRLLVESLQKSGCTH